MIDNIILYFKNLPHLITYCVRRLKKIWKWFAMSLVIGIILVLGLEGIFDINHNTDIAQGRWLFRVTSLIVFGHIVLSVYLSYKFYRKDYMVMKSFHISSVTPTIVIALLAFVDMFILGLIIAFLKPINFETSLLSLIYYLIMTSIFIGVIAVTFGLLKFILKRFDTIYFIMSAICFFIVPILFIPKTHLSIVDHILMLNPVYYLVHGNAQSIIFGAVSMNNIPYHIYFILFLVLMCVINYALVRYIAFDKYDSLNDTHIENDLTHLSDDNGKKLEHDGVFNNNENANEDNEMNGKIE